MTNLAEQRTLPQAATHRSRRFSIIWIVPLVAVAVGAWLAWDTLSKEGPTIKISFESGEGLQAGQSQLKYKDIVFGTVKSLELAPDEVPLDLAGLCRRQHSNIGPRKQGLDAGNISGKQPGFYDPEDGPVGQERAGLVGRGDRHDDVRFIGRKFEAFDCPEHDVLILEL